MSLQETYHQQLIPIPGDEKEEEYLGSLHIYDQPDGSVTVAQWIPGQGCLLEDYLGR